MADGPQVPYYVDVDSLCVKLQSYHKSPSLT